MEHMIRAYPTIQTYTHGENIPAETYYGDRTGGLSQASTECYTDIAGESAVRRCVAAPWVPPIQALR